MSVFASSRKWDRENIIGIIDIIVVFNVEYQVNILLQ